MTPEQLKESIFNYALQGKLVEQRPEEGTAEELYQKIVKVAKKDKNVTEITEEEIPFELPATWKWCKFGEVVDCSMGKTPPRAETVWWGNDIPWVSISDMTDYGHVSSTKEMVSQKALDEKFGSISKAETLLMSFKLTVGRTSILDIDAVHNEAIISIFPYVDNENYFRDYLFYILPIITQWGDSKNAIKGKTLNSKSIANLMLPLAPLNELHRIVAKIEELLPFVDRYAEAYEKLEKFNTRFPEDMKKSILQYAIQGKLVEQRAEEGTAEELYQQIQDEKAKLIKEGKIKKENPLDEITEDEIPFDIPESWKWCRLGDIFQTSSGTTPSKSKLEYYQNGSINWVRTTDLNNSILTSTEVQITNLAFEECRLKIIPYNSVCIALYGGGGTIGKNALIQFETTINQSVCAIHPNALCDMKYVLYFMKYQRPFWMKMAAGSRKDPNINQIIVKNCCFPLPPLAEQHRIVAKIEELFPYCDMLIK